MQQVFFYFLDKSISSIGIICIVLAVRIFLRKAPKIFSYFLWVMVFLRLLLPPFIKIPMISSNIITEQTHKAVGGFTPIRVLPIVWAVVALGLFVYTAKSYILLSLKLRDAEPIFNATYESNQLKTPFVLGLIRPRIYLPAVLKERQREFVVLHERIHIKRRDYLIKSVAWWIVILHWYNPLVWCAYHFMCKDMEMSCDEAVVLKLTHQDKTKYAITLLSLSAEKGNLISVGFSKNSVKERIEHIMKMKRISAAVTVVALFGVAFLGIVLFTTKEGESTAVVNTETLLVRQEPNRDSEVVGMLPKLQRVKILELEDVENEFVKIKFDEGSAYIMKEYITIE